MVSKYIPIRPGLANMTPILTKSGILGPSRTIEPSGMRVGGKGSWKQREVGKFKVGKSEVEKFLFKLERPLRSFKVSFEVG